MESGKGAGGRGVKALYAVYEKGTETCVLLDVTVDEICDKLNLKRGYVRDMIYRQRGGYKITKTGVRRNGVDEYFEGDEDDEIPEQENRCQRNQV